MSVFSGVHQENSRTKNQYWRRTLLLAFQICRLMREHKPDHAILNNTPNANIAGAIACWMENISYFQWVRGPLARTFFSRQILRRASAIFSVGSQAFEDCKALGQRSTPVAEGLSDTQWPQARRRDAHGWLFAASPLKWKGLQLVKSAYQEVAKTRKVPPLHLCVVSKSDLPSPRLGENSGNEITKNVFIHPNWRDLSDVRKQCSVYFHGAISPEPFGRVILESQAAGLCAVVPDQKNVLVKTGVDGLKYEMGCRDSLVQQMNWILDHPNEVQNIGDAAKIKAQGFRAEKTFSAVFRYLAES
ncbi:MAG: glycosyltransferase family 4 protein [Deltaproteobacteria bacterium]|nr:glycosyltransferase family 4 protein [Deltaproteobacteria bacterium]